MATQNKILLEDDGWVAVPFSIASNGGGFPIEVAVSLEMPANDFKGHKIMPNSNGITIDDFTVLSGDSVFFRVSEKSSVLVYE